MEKKKILLGCGSALEVLDTDVEAILWINDYYRNKAKDLCLYKEDVEQYVMPKFWQTQEEFCSAKDYSIKIYKTVMTELARQLDEMHCTCFGDKGWSVILGYWLSLYIEGFYDKYVRIKYAFASYPGLYMKNMDTWYIPKGNDLPNNEILQAQQYQDVYNFLYLNNINFNIGEERYEILPYILSEPMQDSEKNGIRHEIVGIIKKIVCRKDVRLYLCTQYLMISRTTLELLSRGRINRLEMSNELIPKNIISIDARKNITREIEYGDVFINLIYDCLWKHIPMQFVEDFQDYYGLYKEFELKIPVKIVDSNRIYYDPVFKIFAADAISHGGKLEIIQHGGSYCLEKYVIWQEFDIAHKFYTWGDGFSEKNRGNFCAMPTPKTLSVKKKKNAKNILYIGYVNCPYVVRFLQLYTMKMDELYKQEEVFFESLGQNSRMLLSVRCYHEDPWWERKKVLTSMFPWMQFDHNQNFYTSMTKAKLVVTNVISTTCIEAISCNIPTIIFCNDDFFIPDQNAVEILNELRKVKVVLDSAQDAADFINQNEQRIESWWNEKERKDVVNRFRKMYASHDCFAKWKWIKEMLKESKTI